MKTIRKPKTSCSDYKGLRRLLDGIEPFIAVEVQEEMTELFEEGHELEEIAEAFNCDPDYVFIAIFDQARRAKINRVFGRRLKHGKA
jgi:3-deoxy-D-manno-octulosonic acid (KDO) 8-phosphate synthase